MNDLNSIPEAVEQQSLKTSEADPAVVSDPAPSIVMVEAPLTGTATIQGTGWLMIVVKPRVDAFNQDFLVQETRALREARHSKIALELSANRFLSLPVIQFCVELSKQMAEEGGSLTFVGCTQKTKRHFEIYGSLKHIRLVRTARDLAPPAEA